MLTTQEPTSVRVALVSLERTSPKSESPRRMESRMDYEGATAFLGDWGPFQCGLALLLCITMIPNGYASLVLVFAGDTPAHRCLVPAVNLTEEWRDASIPLYEDGRPAECSRYQLEALRAYSEAGWLPSHVNLSAVPREGCLDGWEYDRSIYRSTIVTEWDLVCGQGWKKPLTFSLYYFGCLVGSFLSGQFSDRFGRKKVLFVTLASQTLSAFLQVFMPSWTAFCVLQFLAGMSAVSNYLAAFVLGAELLSPRLRLFFTTAASNIFFALGYVLLPLHAYFLRDWRTLLLGITTPGFLLLTLWWAIPESPRWLLSQGRIAEAEAIVRLVAKRSKMEAPAKIFTTLQKEGDSEMKKYNICDMLRSPNVRWMSVLLWFVWNTIAMGYLTLSLNTSNLHGNAYLNCFLSGAVEIPAYLLTWLMFRRCPRRLTLAACLASSGFFLLVIQLVPADTHWLAMTLEMLGKFSLTAAFAHIYAYTAELYPTVLRNMGMGSCSMASRIGSILAPYIIYLRSYWVSLPYILMGVLIIAAALLSLLLPETYEIPLPETIAETQPFPGCCRKEVYKPTSTKEESQRQSVDVQ
ncbi:organic cation/carnitine transporter 2-like isoform X2 [Syngnathus scovelli]|uniref:organic cation/carnitine transporter 2-like isoform X2 n=1 Tax=Syngnathus scovelli TaxID=161590 RepID=UPI0021105CE6|nr:solute carrier family 22 member 5-like isoform X2 [Syngnathus scovelli]